MSWRYKKYESLAFKNISQYKLHFASYGFGLPTVLVQRLRSGFILLGKVKVVFGFWFGLSSGLGSDSGWGWIRFGVVWVWV